MSEVRGGDERCCPASEVRGGDERSYPTSEARGGGRVIELDKSVVLVWLD